MLVAASDRSYYDEWLFAGCDGFRKRCIRWLVREVFFAGEKAQEGPALQSSVITNGAAEHWILSFQCIEDRALCNRSWDFESHFAAHVG
jgi:hypothetical protein